MNSSQMVPTVHDHVSCEIIITNLCNLKCDYCIARDLPGPPMNAEVGRKVIDMFVYLAEGATTADFIFTGGEPLTEFEVLKELIEYAQKLTDDVGIQANFILKTNGTILNQDILNFLRSKPVTVVVSLDGTSVSHDTHRKTRDSLNGSHNIVCSNLKTFLDNNISCVSSVTVHPEFSKSVLENVCYLHEFGMNQIDIGPAYGTVSWSDTEIIDFTNSLLDVAQYVRDVNNNGTQIDVGPLYRTSDHVDGNLSSYWGCHAASKNLAFLPNGQVTGCSALAMLVSRFPELIIGDISSGLEQSSIDNLVQLAQANGEQRPACSKCATAINCTGGCLAINYSTSGLALTPPEMYCKTISIIPMAWRKAWLINE